MSSRDCCTQAKASSSALWDSVAGAQALCARARRAMVCSRVSSSSADSRAKWSAAARTSCTARPTGVGMSLVRWRLEASVGVTDWHCVLMDEKTLAGQDGARWIAWAEDGV